MFIEERHESILNMLKTQGKVNVKDLSRRFSVSESMIRKDLQALEKRGLLKRTYGGAMQHERILVGEEYFTQRLQKHTEAKEAIAQKALELIEERDVVFLDVCSTSYLLAELLLTSERAVTILSNIPILSTMVKVNSQQKIVLIGGDYHTKVSGCIGSHAISQIREYRCNKAFLGCVGADVSDGSVAVSNSEDAHTKKAIMHISKESYLLIPNAYFHRDGLYTFAELGDFAGVISESHGRSALEVTQYGTRLF